MAFKPYNKTTLNSRPIMGNSNLLIRTIDQSIIRDHLNSVPNKRQVVALINSAADNNHVTAHHQQSKFSNVSSPKAIRDIDLNSIPVNDDDVSDSSASTPPRSLETILKNISGQETKRPKLNNAGWRTRSSHNNHFPALNNNINNVRYFGLTNRATNTRGGGGGISLLSNSMMRNHFSDSALGENFFLMNYPNRSTMSSVAIFGVRMSGPNPPSAPKRCQWCFTTYTPLWRNGPHGLKTLCNACGIRFFKEQKKVKAGFIKKLNGDRI
ncbi:hypothetical protein MKW98_027840 [Papaver atlanticum]|uniref:GATA-type domain-containing protein n=1 Tax=Papaver atlanticum TaxID=357466 RepID=A0AAD4SJE4_9MAGN|nr:hypothetical protein MKW98_027840 [Papaver atlanticum]